MYKNLILSIISLCRVIPDCACIQAKIKNIRQVIEAYGENLPKEYAKNIWQIELLPLLKKHNLDENWEIQDCISYYLNK